MDKKTEKLKFISYCRKSSESEDKQTLSIDSQKRELKRIIDNPYLLYVGNRRSQFKNFRNLAQAFAIILKKHHGIKLICTGSEFTSDELTFFADLGISDSMLQIYANENTMAQLYRDAEMFVYPSVYEGFGLPLLESMVYSCPVACSNTSCFPEIAGNAAVYFDPHDIDSIIDTIDRLLVDSILRTNICNNGKVQLEKYSWDKCAQEHLDVYRSLM